MAGDKTFVCPIALCTKGPYKFRNCVIRHLREKHGDAENLADVIKSVPKEMNRKQCDFCQRLYLNLGEHKAKCSQRPGL